jgi:valyl-tRNA synthetase
MSDEREITREDLFEAGTDDRMRSKKETKEEVIGEKTSEQIEREQKKRQQKAEKELKFALKKAQKEQSAMIASSEKKEKKEKKIGKARSKEDEMALESALGTKKGERKDTSNAVPMATSYNPKAVEFAWYDWWERERFFEARNASKKPKFVIVIPPPNVTGALHIGHALTNSIQDTVVRWRRMSGYEALWVPGTDHAGIATQTVVEKKLMREGKITRHDLGREKFLEKVFEWKGEYGGKIFNQLRRLGSSLDWTREAFTMDEKLSKAVKEAFVKMHEDGLIYRDNRLVNWSCQLKTAISDIEVDHIDIDGPTMLSVPGHLKKVEFGVITSFAYKIKDDPNGDELVVATTRIETMLGDVAVAVHPEDERYKKYHGKTLVHPFDQSREIPIICDEVLVDMSFGTGCVKITPAHDPNDFQTGKRHNLQFINCFTEDGIINDVGGDLFKGMKRFECRVAIEKKLEELGLYRGKDKNPMRLGLCSRSKDVIEPMLKPQWWVNCGDMAKDACDAVRDGRLEILPKEQEATWFRWLENIRDWCISRQLWWGHRIPAFYVNFDNEEEGENGLPGGTSEKVDRWVVGRDESEAQKEAEKKFPGKKFTLAQDEDVLDTWFSSGLFPFSVFGWPDETPDMKDFYPTSLLETGHDILFFWVARMVMMGMKLTGKVPFKKVFLHAMVRDAHGRKMSKSLGNVIDPINVIEGISLEELHETLANGNLEEKELKKATAGQKQDYPQGIPECGTDALRFALMSYTGQGRDVNLDVLRVAAYRNWCNKLWNAIKFAMANLGDDYQPVDNEYKELDTNDATCPIAARWIISCLNNALAVVDEAMESYNFNNATDAIYQFWQNDLCDVFIEIIKPTMNGDDDIAKKKTRDALWVTLDAGLKLLHPFMPFVTEELWQRLPRRADADAPCSIMIATYPTKNEAWSNDKVERSMRDAIEFVKSLRSMKSSYNVAPKAKPNAFAKCSDADVIAAIKENLTGIQTLASVGEITILDSNIDVPIGCGVTVVNDQLTVYIELKGHVDAEKETKTLESKLKSTIELNEKLEKTMSEATYAERVPENVRTQNNEKFALQKQEIAALQKTIEDFQTLLSL